MLIEKVQHLQTQEAYFLAEVESKRVLASGGVPVPAFAVVGSADEAAAAATSIGFPVVVKVASPEILHKSDVGGVVLNVTTAEQARSAFDRVVQSAQAACPRAHVDGALVESMCPPGGVEVVVGLARDSRLGPVVMIGLGGIFVEVLEDVAFRLVPITRADALQMLDDLRGKRLLDGIRGRPPVDRDALADLLLAIAGPDGLALRPGGNAIDELDLNPVFAYPKGFIVADARIVLTRRAQAAGTSRSVDVHDLHDVMRSVFTPDSIAVIGASGDENKHGGRALKTLVDFGYEGDIYPIHLTAAEIRGRAAYRRLLDVPGRVEKVIVAVPKDAVPEAIDQCVAKGVRVAHVYTAGFGELNDAGRKLEQDLLERTVGSSLRIIGPNCMGTYVPAKGISLFPDTVREAGHVAVVSQSGGTTIDIVRRGGHEGLRFSKVISIGNSIDLDPAEFLYYYSADPDTRVIGAYIESTRKGQLLRQALAAAADSGKPVVMLKGGQTVIGQRAAASHTGALSTDFRTWQGAFRQYGVNSVRSLEEMLDALLAFQILSLPKGPGVALIGSGGGVSVTATDLAGYEGLTVPRFAPETVAKLEALGLPPGVSLVNPLDVGGTALRSREGATLGNVISHAVADPGIDALVVHLNLVVMFTSTSFQVTRGLLQGMVSAVIALRSQTDLPICLVVRSTGEPEQDGVVRAERQRALLAGIPTYRSIENALRALGHLYRFSRFCHRWTAARH